jgi:hypothetical protein
MPEALKHPAYLAFPSLPQREFQNTGGDDLDACRKRRAVVKHNPFLDGGDCFRRGGAIESHLVALDDAESGMSETMTKLPVGDQQNQPFTFLVQATHRENPP